jgi:hypothetical protein
VKLCRSCGTNVACVTTNPTPDIRHLVLIIEQDVRRAQTYANLIRVLEFSGEGYWKIETWHPKLMQVEFSRLEEAHLSPLGTYILHYVSGLRHLHICGTQEPPNDCLDRLTERWLNLKNLALGIYRVTSITPESYHQFLQRNQSLDHLNVMRFLTHWISRNFLVSLRYPQLSQLKCPFICGEGI